MTIDDIDLTKLGITPAPWEINDKDRDISTACHMDMWYRVCEYKQHQKYPNNSNLLATAPEMLQMLLVLQNAIITVNQRGECMSIDENNIDALALISLIERATGKSLEDVQKIIGD